MTSPSFISVVRRKRSSKRAPLVLIPHPHAAREKLILRCWYSLGDITLLTVAVRELHTQPGSLVKIRTLTPVSLIFFKTLLKEYPTCVQPKFRTNQTLR